eukprot:2410524-Prymnesium_polylepis.1
MPPPRSVEELAARTAQTYLSTHGPLTPTAALRIVHITDVYTLENFPSLRTLIQEKRAEFEATHGKGSRTICVLTGDFLMPYLLSSVDKGKGMMAMLNGTPVDYVTWGNHEADVRVAPNPARRDRTRSPPAHTAVADGARGRARPRERVQGRVGQQQLQGARVVRHVQVPDGRSVGGGAQCGREARASGGDDRHHDQLIQQADAVQRRRVKDRGPVGVYGAVQAKVRGRGRRRGRPTLPPLRAAGRAHRAAVRLSRHPLGPRPPRRRQGAWKGSGGGSRRAT